MLSLLDTRFLRQMAVGAAQEVAWMYNKVPCRTSKLTGAEYIEELRNGHQRRAYEVFRMPINIFEDLCTWLRENTTLGYAVGESSVTVEEEVGIFLYILGRGASNRDAQERFQHSGETISR
jgi:secreted Zn-dependent insulinase-like peptidase